MTVGEVAPVVRSLSQAMVDRYADASGDHNPIHVDHDFASSSPMGWTIAHGMLVLSFLSEMMTAAFGVSWLATGVLDVRFRLPARPTDTITARARPAESPAAGRLRYAVECLNQAADVLISGTAEVTP